MAFLDNSGDIILDCVLTDLGRQRLGRGDGSFAIRKFALGDDEINYALWDGTNLNGSPYYDITILQTPVLEANSKGNSGLKSKLISLPNSNVLYLPVMQLFLGGTTGTSNTGNTAQHSSNTFIVVSNEATETALGNVDSDSGIMLGWRTGLPNDVHIQVDQGLDTSIIPSTYTLDAADTENQWEVKMDNRFGSLAPSPDGVSGTPGGTGTSFAGAGYNTLDSNNVATYYLNSGMGGGGGGYVTPIGGGGTVPSSIVGPYSFYNKRKVGDHGLHQRCNRRQQFVLRPMEIY